MFLAEDIQCKCLDENDVIIYHRYCEIDKTEILPSVTVYTAAFSWYIFLKQHQKEDKGDS